MKKIRKTDIAIILILTIVFVVIIVANTSLIIHSMMSQTEQVGKTEIGSIKMDFENYIASAENSLVRVASGAEQLMNSTDESTTLEDYIIAQKKTQLDTSNGVNFNVYIAGPGWEIIPDFDAPEDYHATERNWYIGAVEAKGEIYITDPYIDRMTGDMCFTMSQLLSDGETVAAMDFTLSEIQGSIEKMVLSDRSSAIIVTGEGLIVGYKDMSYVGKEIHKALPSYESVLRDIIDNKRQESFVTKIDGNTSTIFWSVTKNDWYMILSVNNSDLYSSAIRQITTNILLNIVMLALIIVLYIFMVRNRIRSEEEQRSREVFVKGLMEKLREPLDRINAISNKGNQGDSDSKEDYASIKTSVLKMNDLMDDLNSYTSIVSNRENTRRGERKNVRDISQTIRISRDFIVALLIIVLVGSSLFYYQIGMKQAEEQMSSNLSYYSYQFDKWEQEQMVVLSMFTDVISADPKLMEDYDSAVKWLDSVAENYPNISVCYLANPYSEHTVIMNNGWEPEEDWKVEEREWYKSTEKSSDGYSISAPYYDEQTGNYCITVSKVVYGKNGEFLGIFGIDLYMDKIINIFGDSYSEGSYVFLVDSNGDIINHPYDRYQMSKSGKVNIYDTPYYKLLSGNQGDVFVFKDYNGIKKCCMMTKDEFTGASVIMVWNWINAYLYQMAYVLIHGVFVLAAIIGVIILLNKVIHSQTDMNQRLREAVKEAEAAGKAKSDFLAQMSHEIRTPINAVIGMDEMILRETDDPNIRDYATDIKSASRTLLSLINGVLDFSKIESGKMEIVPVKYKLSDMIDDLVNMISDRAEKKNLELVLDIDENLPNVLYGDDVRIRQVITNLLTNAVKYTEKGRIMLAMRAYNVTEDDFDMFVEVQDTGIGIKEEDMGRLFKSFQRIDERRNRTIEGTGLGMTIVDGILKLMGSRLKVKSVYGEGSSFSFMIGQKIIDGEPIGEYQRHHNLVTESKNQGVFKIKNAEILVVDDNEMNLKVVRGLMKRLGIVPDLADSGAKSIEMIKAKHYDIVFMDHMMPEMDGLDTLKKLNSDSLIDESTTVIVLTANAIAGAKEMYIANGFKDYLSKPIDTDELEKKLADYLPEECIYYVSSDEVQNTAGKKSEPETDIQKKPEPEKNTWKTPEQDMGNLKEKDVLKDSSAEESRNSNDILGELRKNGINVEEALSYSMDDVDFYIDILGTFIESYYEKIDELEKYYVDHNWNDYRIQVHALKSSARTIGADHLSEMALRQEDAAKEMNEAVLIADHETLMKEYGAVVNLLKDILGMNDDSK